MALAPRPLTEDSAGIFFEAVIAAILASRCMAIAHPTVDQMIAMHKQMLQKLRAGGGSFN
jgi:hypothetical protein